MFNESWWLINGLSKKVPIGTSKRYLPESMVLRRDEAGVASRETMQGYAKSNHMQLYHWPQIKRGRCSCRG